MKKAVIYARARGNLSEQSIQTQINACKEFALRNGFEITQIYTDISTFRQWDRRRSLKKMLKDSAKKNKRNFNAVIIYDFSRVSRNLKTMLKYNKKLKRTGKYFISVTELIDSKSSSLLFNILLEMTKVGKK